MIFKKSIQLVTAMSLLTSGCSQSSNNLPPKTEVQERAQTDLSQLEKLLKGPFPNFALAEIFAQEIKSRHPELGQNILRNIKSKNAWGNVSQELSDEWKTAARSYILLNSAAWQDDILQKNSLIFNYSEMESTGGFSGRIQMQIAAIAKAEALEKIMSAYNKAIEEDAKYLSQDMVVRWDERQKDVIKKVESIVTDDVKEKAQKIYEVLVKYDKQLATYQFPDRDKNRLLVYTVVAAALANHLKENNSVKSLIKSYQKGKEIKERIERLGMLLNSIDKHNEEIKSSWNKMKVSFEGIQEDLKIGAHDIIRNPGLSPQTKKNLEHFVDGLLNGVEEGAEDLQSRGEKLKGIYTSGVKLTESANQFLDSSKQVANSLDHLLTSAEKVAAVVGVELGAPIKDAINTARKVSEGIEFVNLVTGAFQKGGLAGAMASIASGPGLALVGASAVGLGGGDQTAADLGEIKKDLQEIKRMQKQTLELQKATIGMIRDLALMIDENHQREMALMEDIRDEVLVSKQLIAIQNEQRLKACNSMLAFGSTGHDSVAYASGVKDFSTVRKLVVENNQGFQAINKMLRGPSEKAFEECALGMSLVFTEGTNDAFLLRHFYSIADGEGLKVEKKLFHPALNYLSSQAANRSVTDMALYVPVRDVKTLLFRKNFYIYDMSSTHTGGQLSKLNDLIAPLALEKFVSTLLAIHPFISLDLKAWADLETAMSFATDTIGGAPLPTARSQGWLKGALEKTKTAIAQEAILSGEPLLFSLNRDFNKITIEKTGCERVNEEPFCFVRRNSLMMKNLIIYRAHQDIRNASRSGSCYLQPEYFGLKEDDFVLSQGRCYLKLGKLQVELPPYENVQSGKLLYTETMGRLMRLQQAIAAEITQVNPHDLDSKRIEQIRDLLLVH
ncbi:hypothetical protein [Bdellovibrio reynosensis]|uniref:Uncharacterized protein n=1 Tax=Bdellovibrio reynosensis TaxID=2835041 RepID=A0ABY4C9S1_9BACT|nr:hypothetical protein [Bdellovibrio reynosensis]UOF01623.1 hypothetical protein MNR06_01480 [Bdellovibrio reynosensis]